MEIAITKGICRNIDLRCEMDTCPRVGEVLAINSKEWGGFRDYEVTSVVHLIDKSSITHNWRKTLTEIHVKLKKGTK